jgi:inorganic pyrophosphatase
VEAIDVPPASAMHRGSLDKMDTNDANVEVVVETPKGSRNKYAFDPKRKIFTLKKVLPAGMSFPYDFGFVPSTRGGDGDPIDVLVLMDEPAFPGCVLNCRPIGVIEGEQVSDGQTQRNDRVVAVQEDNHSYAAIAHIDDLGKPFVRELGQFFTNYHELWGDTFTVLGVRGPRDARKCIDDGRRSARKKKRR